MLALTALPSEAKGEFSSFDEPPEAGLSVRPQKRSVRFDLALNRAASDGHSRWFSHERYAAFGEQVEADSGVRVYGEWNALPTHSGLTAFDLTSPSLDPATRRRSLLGMRWEHRLDHLHSIAIAAEYGSHMLLPVRHNPALAGSTIDTRAVVSWTGRFSGDWRPSLTSSVFLGDEAARGLSLQPLGRSYYGFTLGGEMTLLESHTPYVSFRLQRSDYDIGDSLNGMRQDYRSLLSAGWRWQVQRGLSLQAEASYGFSGEHLDLLAPERGRLFFGTRFDFR